MRISDWSSDVCSSDLLLDRQQERVDRPSGNCVARGRIMLKRLAMIAPLALLLPAAGGANEAPASRAESLQGTGVTFQAPVQHQVRIEQRVVLRISPRSTSARQNQIGRAHV